MDRSLASFLRSLQTSLSTADAQRLLPTATALLSRLSNPLNLTLLSAQILEADILYPQPLRLPDARQIFSVFYTATLRFREDKRKARQLELQSPLERTWQQHEQEREKERSLLSEVDWFTAVVKGAGERSSRWRHALMLGAVLLASCAESGDPLVLGLRQKLEGALVVAINLALGVEGDVDGHMCVVFVLNHTFLLLADEQQRRLDWNRLLVPLVQAAFFSQEGLEGGYWVRAIDEDVVAGSDRKFGWSTRSRSFVLVQEIKSRPFVAGLGGLSRLMARAIDAAVDRAQIIDTVTRLTDFARTLAISWRHNKLSEVDISEEAESLSSETTRASLPVLLQIWRDTMFAMIIALRSVTGRLLTDQFLASDINAPGIAIQSLHILRDMYFIAHRFGQTSSSQYVFVNFTALDLLNQYPRAAENYLATTKPKHAGRIPTHPLDRNLDLFFLNTAEHLTLTVSARTNDELLEFALPYIQAQGDPRLGELYEAGHSVMLAVFAAPQNAPLLPKYVPLYVETLMESFPQTLNPRQFRLAIKSIVKLASPPSAVANLMPHLQAIILDLLSQRLVQASELSLPAMSDVPVESQPQLSEKAILMQAIIDSLPALPAQLLREWLPIAADLLFKIASPAQRAICQQKFWEVLSNGDMDVDRSATCVTWWNNRGGRELVLLGEVPDEAEEYTMSGALGQGSKL